MVCKSLLQLHRVPPNHQRMLQFKDTQHVSIKGLNKHDEFNVTIKLPIDLHVLVHSHVGVFTNVIPRGTEIHNIADWETSV